MHGDDGKPAFGLNRPDFLNQMHEQLEDLVAARDQMGHLLEVAIQIGSDLDIDATLQRILTTAKAMTGAQYAALGVWAPDGTLASFLHAGIDEHLAAMIGHLPVGKGVLGLMLERTEPLRLPNLTEHPAAVGYPADHPPMRAFLGMPIVIRGATYGSLYVTDARPERTFSDADEVTIRALGSAASVAIDNARLFERVQSAARWTEASREITTALLADGDPHLDPLQLIVERAAELTGAEQAIVLVPAEPDVPSDEVDTLVVSAAVGRYAEEVLGQEVPIVGSTTGDVFRSGEPLITDRFRRPIQAFTDVGERPAIVMPLRSEEAAIGVIAVARSTSAAPFDASYLDLVSGFAGHAAIALTLANARAAARELTVLADRERIARDLHDRVIQRVFAVGMSLQGTVARLRAPEIAQRISQAIDELQEVINDIRLSIFDLQHAADAQQGLGQRIREAVARITEDRDVVTELHVSGPLTVVSEVLGEHAEAVVVEALSNAVRHAEADLITIRVGIADDLTIEVTDDGRGIPADNQRHSGLVNMAGRAEEVGGRCVVDSPQTGGTRVTWSAPLVG